MTSNPFGNELRGSPCTMLLMAACALVAIATRLGDYAERAWFLFYPMLPIESLGQLLGAMDSPGDALRTLTPMFLHFGEMHLIFNLLWLWYFGRQLERLQPSWVFLAVVLLTSFAANTTQYLVSGYPNFGGMSGVVYGLVGYTWMIHQFMPRSQLAFNGYMMVAFVVMLVGMFVASELLASLRIATPAHVGGLLAGLALGALMVGFYRLLLGRASVGGRR